MRLRLRRRNLVVWSSSAAPTGGSEGPWRARPTYGRRIRWWFRTGALLAVIGVLRLGRATRTHWEPISLLAGTLLTAVGFMLPSAAGTFPVGLLVLIVALIKGIRDQSQRGDWAR